MVYFINYFINIALIRYMKTESENLSAQQSLEIITSMIAQAQGKVQKNVFYFLLWGWVVAIANLGMYTLIQLNYTYPYVAWAITIPAWIFSMYKGFRHSKEAGSSSSHFDSISAALWIGYGIVIFTLVGFGAKINYQLNPVILLFSAVPTCVSGVILRFKPLIIGGILFWIFGIVCFLVPTEFQFIVGAVAIVLGYLVPGYLMKSHQPDRNV